MELCSQQDSNRGPGRLPRSAESWLSLALSKLQKAAHGFLSGASATADSGHANVMLCVCFLEAQSRPAKFLRAISANYPSNFATCKILHANARPDSHHYGTVSNETVDHLIGYA